MISQADSIRLGLQYTGSEPTRSGKVRCMLASLAMEWKRYTQHDCRLSRQQRTKIRPGRKLQAACHCTRGHLSEFCATWAASHGEEAISPWIQSCDGPAAWAGIHVRFASNHHWHINAPLHRLSRCSCNDKQACDENSGKQHNLLDISLLGLSPIDTPV